MSDVREQVYDDQINPLVAHILAICKEHQIPILISAGMVNDDGEPLMCSSILCHGKESANQLRGIENRYSLALGIIQGHSGFDTAAGLMITRNHPEDTP